MSNCVKKATTTILLKLASSDREINIDELELIEKFADDQPADELFSNAVELDIPELVEEVDKLEDRFVIRMKARFMAEADGVITPEEQRLIDKLAVALSLPDDYVALLHKAVELEYTREDGAMQDAEIKAIYMNSSFAE